MCDECTDSSNREQLVLCICWIDHGNLEPQEDVIGMYQIDDISAHTIVSVIRDMLVRMNFSLSRCRGQCYDAAANMKGGNTGVAKQLLDEEPPSFIHPLLQAHVERGCWGCCKTLQSDKGCTGHHL